MADLKQFLDYKLEAFEQAETIEIIPMHNDNWSLTCKVDGKRYEEVMYATGIDASEDEQVFVDELIKVYPQLADKNFEF